MWLGSLPLNAVQFFIHLNILDRSKTSITHGKTDLGLTFREVGQEASPKFWLGADKISFSFIVKERNVIENFATCKEVRLKPFILTLSSLLFHYLSRDSKSQLYV